MNFICPNVYEIDIKRFNVEHGFYFSVFTWLSRYFYKKRKNIASDLYCINVGIGLRFAYFPLKNGIISS